MTKRIIMRVGKGGIVPADEYAREQLRERNYRVDDIVAVDIRKARNPRFNRLVHAFGKLLAANVETFHGMDAHSALKRVQVESGIGCDEIAMNIPGVGPVMYRVPKSISFESIDETEFSELYRGWCVYVADTYWGGLEPERVDEMAELMTRAA